MWEIRFMIFIVAFFSLFDFSFLPSPQFPTNQRTNIEWENILYRISFHKFLCHIINGHKGMDEQRIIVGITIAAKRKEKLFTKEGHK